MDIHDHEARVRIVPAAALAAAALTATTVSTSRRTLSATLAATTVAVTALAPALATGSTDVDGGCLGLHQLLQPSRCREQCRASKRGLLLWEPRRDRFSRPRLARLVHGDSCLVHARFYDGTKYDSQRC